MVLGVEFFFGGFLSGSEFPEFSGFLVLVGNLGRWGYRTG
jgi:hypothetical protein